MGGNEIFVFASNVNGYHGDCAAHRVCSFRRGFHRGTQQHLVMNWKEIKKNIYYLKSATIIQYTIKGRFMSR